MHGVLLWLVLLPLNVMVMDLSLCRQGTQTEAVYNEGRGQVCKHKGECTLEIKFLSSLLV